MYTSAPNASTGHHPVKVAFPNPDFPILAMMYAVVIGGEHETYCDHTVDYAQKYLIGRFNDPGFKGPRDKFLAVLSDLDRQNPTRDRTKTVLPSPAQWDILCQALAEELKRGPVPSPVW